MKTENYSSATSKIFAENRLIKFVLVGMVLLQVILAYSLVFALKHQRTIVLPAVVDRPFEIRGNEYNEDYIKMMSRYLSGLFLNYTHASIEEQFSDFLKFVDPASFASTRKKMVSLMGEVTRLRIDSSFYYQKAVLLPPGDTVSIVGRRIQRTDGTLVSDTMEKYLMTFDASNGKFIVKTMTAGN